MAVVARMKNRMTMHNRQSPMLKHEKKSIKLIKEGGGVRWRGGKVRNESETGSSHAVH